MPDPRLRKIFLGPTGIRAGWRLLIYLPLTCLLTEVTSALLGHIPLTAHILSAHVRGIMTAAFGIVVYIPILLAFPLPAATKAHPQQKVLIVLNWLQRARSSNG